MKDKAISIPHNKPIHLDGKLLEKKIFNLLDQLFAIEQKLEVIKEPNRIGKNISKIKDIVENIYETPSQPNTGFIYDNPIGENYVETRTDLEVSIAGESTENLIITEVIKPIIRFKSNDRKLLARNGVAVVESKTDEKEIESE
jgi:hypothetical protein